MGIPCTVPAVVDLNKLQKVKIYNLSSKTLSPGAISVSSLGPKFVPYSPSDSETTKIDILNFSRILLLKARFHNSTFDDPSIISPISNYIPKCTSLENLKGIVEELEFFANKVVDLTRETVDDNLTIEKREGLNF